MLDLHQHPGAGGQREIVVEVKVPNGLPGARVPPNITVTAPPTAPVPAKMPPASTDTPPAPVAEPPALLANSVTFVMVVPPA
jgi:hypothetical protein